jgi:cytochrome c-type biogenesis protein CcmH
MIRFLLCLLAAALARGQEPTPRERALQDKLVAVCCWNESIAHHRSDTALQMRMELHRLVEEGRTDAEILDWFKNKYTARVLIEPEGAKSVAAYALPAAAAMAGLVIVVWLLRRWSAPPAGAA